MRGNESVTMSGVLWRAYITQAVRKVCIARVPGDVRIALIAYKSRVVFFAASTT